MVEDMDASNPLSTEQAASPSLPTVLSPSAQAGAIVSPAVEALEVPALVPAAALQYQFNIQQSLLMQQYAFAQQAAVKAATVKSAAEVAAARAAEISKQLEKKSQSSSSSKSASRSPSQLKSKSRSKSRSRSRSRSRSPSPIRKRRERSYSRSPIRYRRDYHSSYRPREHYRYRGYNYRSYYRGSYNDYSRYRYERDHYRRRSRSRGARRSRTRSRSRSKSRSRSRSRSPRRERRRRSRTISPPAKNRSYTQSPRDSRKKSLSPHVRRDGTKSGRNRLQSESKDAERSPSVSSRSITSPPAKSRSRSSSPVKAGKEDKSPSTELSHGMGEDRLAFVDRKPERDSSISSHGRRQSSSSTSKSLSVSLDDQSNENAPSKVAANQRSSSVEPMETVKALSPEYNEDTSKRTASDEVFSHGKMDESEGWNKISGGGRRMRKPMRSPNAIFHDESEGSDESLDDWREDLKQIEKEKGLVTQKDVEADRLEGHNGCGTDSFVKITANDEEPKHEVTLQDDNPGHNDSATAMGEQVVTTYQGYRPAVVPGDEESLRGEIRQVSVSENAEEVCTEVVQYEQVVDEDVIFEGPKLASPVSEQKVQKHEAAVADEKSPGAKWSTLEKKASGSPWIVEDDEHCNKDFDKRHSHEKKVKDRSKSRDCKNYEGEVTKHEKHRDRHKKHRKKHRYVDEESAERDGARRRHKRKHKKEEEHGNKEKKKQKHKHRTKSSSVSAEDSSSDSEGELRSRKRRKRGSKRRKDKKRDVLESPPLSVSQG